MSTRVYDYDVLWHHSCTRIVSPIVKVLIWVWECLPQYDMIFYMYFVLKIAGSDRALHKMILEMIKHFTLLIWLNTLIYYRLRTLGGNLLHWILSPWLSAVCGLINSHIVLFVKPHTSALHVKTSKREKVTWKHVYLWVRRFSLPCLRVRTPNTLYLRTCTLCKLKVGCVPL